MVKRSAVLAALLFLAMAGGGMSTARAGETTIGVTLNATIGTHSEPGVNATLPLVPVPIFTIEHHEGNFSLFLEGLPPIGPVAYSNVAPGSPSGTKIGMLDGALRYALPNRRFWVGMGETVVNQTTDYARYSFGSFSNGSYTVNVFHDEVDASRIVGGRYEIGGNLLHGGPQRIDVSLALSPSMHARFSQTTTIGESSNEPGFVFTPNVVVGKTGESAALVDARAGWSVTRGRSTLSAGLRYINYAADFDDGSPADRNTLVLPFVGWSTRL